jgi:hypothetical protein
MMNGEMFAELALEREAHSTASALTRNHESADDRAVQNAEPRVSRDWTGACSAANEAIECISNSTAYEHWAESQDPVEY